VPPAGQLGLTTLLVGAPGSGKTTASERLAYLAARERRSLCVIDGKGTDGLDEAIAAAMLSAWPEARIAAFPQRPVDLWDASPQQLANRLVAAWQFSDEAEFYEQAAMLGLRCALTAPGPPARSTAELVTRLDPGWLERAWQGHQGTLSLIQGPMKGRPGRCPPSGPRTWRPAWGRPGMGTGGWTTSRGHLHPAHHPGERQGQRRGHAVLIAAYAQHIASRRREARQPPCCCSMSSAASPAAGPWPSTSWNGPGARVPGCCCRRSRPPDWP
jgi:hypothetical protein